jgi:hypothetical protein
MRRVFLPFLPVVCGVMLGFGGPIALRRHTKHHDAAFCAIMYEIWEHPPRETYVKPDQTTEYQELNQYLLSGFWNIMVNEPPLDASERFEGVSVEDYDRHCLEIAQAQFKALINKVD